VDLGDGVSHAVAEIELGGMATAPAEALESVCCGPEHLHRLGPLTPAFKAGAEEVLRLRRSTDSVHVEDAIVSYITAIARASRRSPDLSLGASPRASIAVLAGSRVRALMEGRDFVIPDDVKALVPPAYRHRILLRPEAEIQGVSPDDAVARILAGVEVPR